MASVSASPSGKTGLTRHIGLLGLAATGICSMLGAAINFIPFMIQRNVPGIGADVLGAFLFAAIPALLAALAYAILGSAMPRAGGSYVYASRAIGPYVGFAASFSQWFGLSIAIGVVSYMTIPFMRDIAITLDMPLLAANLEGTPRLLLALLFLWFFVYVNLRGVKLYEKTLVPLMFLMFALGAVVIIAGFSFDHADFAAALQKTEGRTPPVLPETPFSWGRYFAGAAVLFASFIGFDSIAQAGGEAKNPERAIPIAIGIAILGVGSFYVLFTAAVYHAVPWQFVASEAAIRDISAPGLLGYLLSPQWTVLIVAGAVIALINDLPAMLLAVSRLMFAWAEDGIFPRRVAGVHPEWHTPHIAILLSAGMASISILGCHLAGDFFLGVDILLISMLVNFLLMCLSVLFLPLRNPEIAAGIKVIKSRPLQIALASAGSLLLAGLLFVQIKKDLESGAEAWYFHSTWVWLLVMAVASLIYLREMNHLKKSGVDTVTRFSNLPAE